MQLRATQATNKQMRTNVPRRPCQKKHCHHCEYPCCPVRTLMTRILMTGCPLAAVIMDTQQPHKMQLALPRQGRGINILRPPV